MMKTIDELKEYIEHREEILKRYGTSRWYDQSKRDIEQLKAELRLREGDAQPKMSTENIAP